MCIYVSIHIYICVCIYVYTCVYISICIYIYNMYMYKVDAGKHIHTGIQRTHVLFKKAEGCGRNTTSSTSSKTCRHRRVPTVSSSASRTRLRMVSSAAHGWFEVELKVQQPKAVSRTVRLSSKLGACWWSYDDMCRLGVYRGWFEHNFSSLMGPSP